MWIDFSQKRNNILKYMNLEKDINSFLNNWYDNSNIIKIKTSGSTGKSKNIILYKKHMYQRAVKTVKYLKLDKKKVVKGLLCLSPNVIASKMLLIRAIIFKWKIFCIEPTSNPLEKIPKFCFDIASMVPIQVFYSIKNIKNIKIVLIGGGNISKYIKRKLLFINSTDFYDTFGMTETCGNIAIKKINNYDKYYKSFNDVKIDVDNRNCLNIKFSNFFIQTNDIVNIKNKNTFEWIGRYDTIINSGGIKIIPELVEKYFSSIIDRRYFIYKIPNKILGEQIILIVEGDPYTLKISSLKSSKYFKPKKIFFVKKFKEKLIGKIDKEKTVKKLLKNCFIKNNF